MKLLVLIALTFLMERQALAECKLAEPIDLKGLAFAVGHEDFPYADSSPDIRTLMSNSSEVFFSLPTTLRISYVQDFSSNIRNGTFQPTALGAHLNLGDTVHSFGMADYYTNSNVEKIVTKTGNTETHTVKKYWEKNLEEMSVIQIVDQKIVSIELTEATFGVNPKSTCVTEASK